MAGPPDAANGPEADAPDLWPAVMWILLGVGIYATAPDAWAWWKGFAYFLLGAPLMLLVTGTATARLNRTVTAMLKEVLPADDWLRPVMVAVLRAMLIVMEAWLVLYLSHGLARFLG